MRIPRWMMTFTCGLALILALSLSSAAVEKVILDTDMVQLFDDGVAMIMLANHPNVELLGVTPVAGNTWAQEGTAYALRQLEIMNRPDIPVAQGARFPLRPSRNENIKLERQLFGIGASSYVGAFGRPEPPSYLELAENRMPYGGYPQLEPINQHAVDFIIETVKANPGEVTICAIGPCTNLALAIRKAPEIIPMVKRVVYMGASFDIPGNTTPAAEFNWWFDPEAAKICVQAPFADQLIVPLDVCEKYLFAQDIYDRIVAVDTPVTRFFKDTYGPRFEKDLTWTRLVWDTIAAASIIDPTLDTEVEERFVDVNADYDLDYGRSLGYKMQGPAGTHKLRILFSIDEARFWDLMVEMLTKPVEQPAEEPAA